MVFTDMLIEGAETVAHIGVSEAQPDLSTSAPWATATYPTRG